MKWLHECLAEMKLSAEVEDQFYCALALKAKGDFGWFKFLRKVWEPNLELLLKGERIDPYFIDWMRVFTPIEVSAWSSIRGTGLPMYPQIPVGNRFIDFGDPVKKIGLECDGKQHVKEEDYWRDEEVGRLGWVIYRARGNECFAPDYFEEEDDNEWEARNWINSSVEGLLRAIGIAHYGKCYGAVMRQAVPDVLQKHSNFNTEIYFSREYA